MTETIRAQITVTRDGSVINFEGDRNALGDILTATSHLQHSLPESEQVAIAQTKAMSAQSMAANSTKQSIAISGHRLQFCIAAFLSVFAIVFVVAVAARADVIHGGNHVWAEIVDK